MQKSSKKAKIKKTDLTDLYDLALPKIRSRPPSWSALGSEELSNVKKEIRDFHTLLIIFKCIPVLFLYFLKELHLQPVLHSLVASLLEVELVSAVGVV